jgi:thymidylate synthase (FAD)
VRLAGPIGAGRVLRDVFGEKGEERMATDAKDGLKIITEPKVYLVADNVMIFDGTDEFLTDIGVPDWQTNASTSGEALVEMAGRLCYMSFANPRPGGNTAYINHILEVGHGSVLEHAVFTIIITGISRSLSHEIVRHRVGLSPSQLSQRFVDSSDVAFVVPPLYLALPADHAACREWEDACFCALETYRTLIEIAEILPAWKGIEDKTARRKAAREAARSVLPNCTETKICLTGNARAFRHMLELRGSRFADQEFRRLAFALLNVLRGAAPHIFADYHIETTADGIQEIVTDHRKV